MAQRPIFLTHARDALVDEVPLTIKWNSGFSASQKKKNVLALHEAAREYDNAHRLKTHPLEISTKSETALGRKLSAFNLLIELPDGRRTSVECAYQGSKAFERGGPFTDIYDVSSIEAKRDNRLRESGALTHFAFFGEQWQLHPQTAFYDWLYISALSQSDMGDEILAFSGFTDIEFNPNKSFNCQARAVAMFVSLIKRDGKVNLTPEDFVRYYDCNSGRSQQLSML